VQNKKQRDTAKQDAEMKLKREAAEKAENTSDKENAEGSADILGEQEDTDVIF
jgi:V-type H+-transporting ATPase subunit D